ncbi:heat-inducible transcriptional repressor HrcA [Acholeplasma sp. OttesenSCG-928-E16]|nr:heat-inducible transcriptional repressor HrcA [Acholeplasma sp. OttesenSCG-928-E16]
MISSRQKLILKAIIELYSKDGIPVGSKQLTSLPYLDFSSATLRYDMAELENLGFLEKTHTSSGRIPSKMGYQFYVENLVTRDSEVLESFPLIDEILSRKTNRFEDATTEAIKLLSELTNYATVAIGPSGKTDIIKKIDFIPMDETRAVVLIVTDKGNVMHNNINVEKGSNIAEISKVVKTISDLFQGRTVGEAKRILELEYSRKEVANLMQYQEKIIESFIDAFARFTRDNFYLSGVSNVLDQPEFHNVSAVRKLVDMFDRRDLLNVVLDDSDLSIKFGNDMRLMPYEDYTVISIPYKINDDDSGTIAVVGPRRMEYKKVIPLLEYIATHLGKLYRK